MKLNAINVEKLDIFKECVESKKQINSEIQDQGQDQDLIQEEDQGAGVILIEGLRLIYYLELRKELKERGVNLDLFHQEEIERVKNVNAIKYF